MNSKQRKNRKRRQDLLYERKLKEAGNKCLQLGFIIAGHSIYDLCLLNSIEMDNNIKCYNVIIINGKLSDLLPVIESYYKLKAFL